MTSRIVVSLRVHASPERAFDVFVREIGAWWRPNELFRFSSRSPGKLLLEPGPDGRFLESYEDGEPFVIGRIVEWRPGSLLSFTWRQESFDENQSTRVEVMFEPVSKSETRVKVEHFGWDSVPSDHVARHGFPDSIFLQRHAEWWQRLLGSLQIQVDASPLDHLVQ